VMRSRVEGSDVIARTAASKAEPPERRGITVIVAAFGAGKGRDLQRFRLNAFDERGRVPTTCPDCPAGRQTAPDRTVSRSPSWRFLAGRRVRGRMLARCEAAAG
jgi:hypothetical protein